ncbi:hypothetical protein K437DRAFT_78202 [Tilletiaria anomala UBC 951]|uniref:Major facilitator superfamily (MFS) profile domain-containing protein n=1 Tax=Tilletiaria anomala (strain ATCC 24038 / CBS 436.72 / UBC 951) TaxID=1037660 RepID=A0A066V1W5_TILAU|nr:uncharacterized protein K437DRAFT_78202 [Tilletiaria anomala UBC 951]KDN35426.1 hypothetical protein K437DRAFT_78202 [Tilletiaria anomala UBC 951]
MSFSCNMLLVNQSATLLRAGGAKLGTLNGLAQMSSSVMRALGPYAASALFAWSVEKNILHGKLVWPVLSVIGVLAIVVTTQIEDLEARIRNEEGERHAQVLAQR